MDQSITTKEGMRTGDDTASKPTIQTRRERFEPELRLSKKQVDQLNLYGGPTIIFVHAQP